MPRDLHRLAAPAVFCNNVRRSVRRQSPLRRVSRQRERFDDRETEYDDFAAEIASYNRLRRGDRYEANSVSSGSRLTYEFQPSYDDYTLPQSDTRYVMSHIEKDDRLRPDDVSAYSASAAYISGDHIPHDISQLDRGNSQSRKHKKKRKHHHCHSRSKLGRHSENGSCSHPPRDTIAALKALAEYGDTNHYTSSVSSVHCYDSAKKSQRKRRSTAAIYHVAEEQLLTEKAGAVNSNLSSSPVVDSAKDNLSLGECSDDDDSKSVDMYTMQDSSEVKPICSLPDIVVSECTSRSSPACVSESLITASCSEDTKTVSSCNVPHLSDKSSTKSDCTDCTVLTSCIPDASSSTDSKAQKEHVPTKRDRSSADRSDGRSSAQSRYSPNNKQTSTVSGANSSASDEKQDKQKIRKPYRSARNYRKKSETRDDGPESLEDMSLPRYVSKVYIYEES